MPDIPHIQKTLIALLQKHIGALKITADTPTKFEVTGTIEAMQGKKKVDGMYFATVIPKPKDVRLYFFPAYTHKEQLGPLPDSISKFLKGKSCFHIKKMDEEIAAQLETMVDKAIALYQADGLI